jgi:hypothetical protein
MSRSRYEADSCICDNLYIRIHGDNGKIIELPTLPENLSSPPVFSGVHVIFYL